MADGALVRRIGDIVSLRPELAGHLCSALIEAALLDRVIGVPELRDSMKTLPWGSRSNLFAASWAASTPSARPGMEARWAQTA